MSEQTGCDPRYHAISIVGHGGTLVESMPFDRRVVGSNPALAATLGPLASPSLTVALCKFRHSVNCCGRERFLKAHAVRSAIEMDKYNTIQKICSKFVSDSIDLGWECL